MYYVIICSGYQVLIFVVYSVSWWCQQMQTFSVLLAFCQGDFTGTCEFPAQRPVTGSFDVFLDLRLNQESKNNGDPVIWDAIALIITSL